MGLKTDHIWVIAYINRNHIPLVKDELSIWEYDNVEAYIPTIKLLKKKFKGKDMFEMVPLLFNYGFFKMPYEKACDPSFLMTLRHRITCIYGWVKDPAKATKEVDLSLDNGIIRNALPKAAMATDEEVAKMTQVSKELSIYDQDNIDKLKEGDYIKLEGYPFEGMMAQIIDINPRNHKVKVKLHLEEIVKEVTVSFENVFYTIYKNFNENTREKSTDEMIEKHGSNIFDSITFKNNQYEQ
ncbi:MAG: hypothetical protein CL596_05025 [Alteromonas sp.]|nr:hypothetical protein [Alteromonas sp.]|tara:strand:- start:567 stop:1286 length:720 start_codon:yes stop_codon:yes gene_type:complete